MAAIGCLLELKRTERSTIDELVEYLDIVGDFVVMRTLVPRIRVFSSPGELHHQLTHRQHTAGVFCGR